MKPRFRDYLPVFGYVLLLALLVVPIIVVRYPFWFVLPLSIVVLRIAYDAVLCYRRIARGRDAG